MPESESKEIKCEWLIDVGTGWSKPTNTEARTMFDEHAPKNTIR
jgi:hypothetical protein